METVTVMVGVGILIAIILITALIIIGIGTVIANISITSLVFKLYTEYWKDSTIKRRYEKQD